MGTLINSVRSTMSDSEGSDGSVSRVELEDGVVEWRLRAGSATAVVVSYGATLTSFKVPDRAGAVEEVTVCHRDLDGLRTRSRYFGCTTGRVANRIAGGKFKLDGNEYSLAVNNGQNALHGGLVGFDKRNWSSRAVSDRVSVEFQYVSADGEEGYPGALTTTVTYTLQEQSGGYELRIDYHATVEGAATPINLTNHTYWNLSGECRRKITTQRLALSCPRYLPFNEFQIPVGEERPVAGTLFDFGPGDGGGDGGVLLSERIPHIDGAGQPGLDHCFCVDRQGDAAAAAAAAAGAAAATTHMATLSDPESGRRLQVFGTQPGVQVYSANWLSQDPEAHPFTQHNAMCLETQHYPDSINQPQFPSCVLRPSETYQHTALFLFTTFE